MNTESLLEAQKALAIDLARFLSNVKKLGLSKRTIGGSQAKLRELEELWGEVNRNHSVLCRHLEPTSSVAKEYFKLYEEAGVRRQDAYNILHSQLLAASAPQQSATSSDSEDSATQVGVKTTMPEETTNPGNFPIVSAHAEELNKGAAAQQALSSAPTEPGPSLNTPIQRTDSPLIQNYAGNRNFFYANPTPTAVPYNSIPLPLFSVSAPVSSITTPRVATHASIYAPIISTAPIPGPTMHSIPFAHVSHASSANTNVFDPRIPMPIQQIPGTSGAQFLPPQLVQYPGYNYPQYQNMDGRMNLPKLPPVDIPKFSGKFKDWRDFFDIFTSVIHTNPSLGHVTKFQYLRSYLSGDAKQCIKHLQLTAQNYSAAIQILQNRFENKRAIISSYLDIVLEHKQLQHRSAEDILSLHDAINECMLALENMNYEITNWDTALVYIASKKLDSESQRLFEDHLTNPREMPTHKEFLEFLIKRHTVLKSSQKSSTKSEKQEKQGPAKKSFHSTTEESCPLCKDKHKLTRCDKFKDLSVSQRKQLVDKNKICLNCLGHDKKQKCSSKNTCRECQRKHHTLLHFPRAASENTHEEARSVPVQSTVLQAAQSDVSQVRESSSGEDVTSLTIIREQTVLLATALIWVEGDTGHGHMLRALVDPGSQVSLITESAAQLLHLKKFKVNTAVKGIGGTTAAQCRHQAHMVISPRFSSEFRLSVRALVNARLTNSLPDKERKPFTDDELSNIILADPEYYHPGPIDMILGADVYIEVVRDNIKKSKNGKVFAQNTHLGWILYAKSSDTSTQQSVTSMVGLKDLDIIQEECTSALLALDQVDEMMRRFWDMDDAYDDTIKHPSVAEATFQDTTIRDQTGRFIVRLPFKDESAIDLGESRQKAYLRFLHMERKFLKDPKLAHDYKKFLDEYKSLGHMVEAPPFKGDNSKVYYLPHHAVMKESSTTTKLRVVFDASAKTSSGKSLNDLLEVGEKIQQDLQQILIRWRKHRYVLNADIEKMFRQIKVSEQDWDYQRILWRPSPKQPIREYRLTTVTYGMASATFLAVRTLHKLAELESDEFPETSKILIRDFYVDDLMSGADTKAEAILLQEQLRRLLENGGMNLRKWCSNDVAVLNGIPEHQQEIHPREFKPDSHIKTLGIIWSPNEDYFSFQTSTHDTKNLSKRQILSITSKIYDPLGWLSPVTITAKIMMSKLWTIEGLDWDTPVPPEINAEFTHYQSSLSHLSTLRVPRWINYRVREHIEIHGFCDASEKGYAAAVYARTQNSSGHIKVTLICAKTRIAPLKKKLTIPCLELCGAYLLATLLTTTVTSLELKDVTCYYWTDSEIVLAWLNKSPTNWRKFVATRVLDIQLLTKGATWQHVPTADNPADVATRGISPQNLPSHPLWWSGPKWLLKPTDQWSNLQDSSQNTAVSLPLQSTPVDIFQRFSSWKKLVRVVAYLRRFASNCWGSPEQRTTGPLKSNEIFDATRQILHLVQVEVFPLETKLLKAGKSLPHSSNLLSLNVFYDEGGLIRVGGRLNHSKLPSEAKHQILMPSKHHVTNLIIDDAHKQTMHGGTLTTNNHLRSRYWIIRGKSTVAHWIHQCVKCNREKHQISQQLMGNLPECRVTPSPPFTRTGLDYAGPFLTRMSKGSRSKAIKGYVAVFICMSTKAIHLELVSDLTTNAFLAAYKRFTARRGHCLEIYSDNGTNFVGANRKLEADLQQAIAEASEAASSSLANDGVQWNFIPPGSPSLGGLWESAVRSMKKHLVHVIGDTVLTFEEFSTVLSQIEAVLNSRPIGQISDDPTDCDALTPGHFLIGRPMIAPPEPLIEERRPNIRWALVTKLHQDFWKRWASEYLHLLQTRSKWKRANDNICIGELVLIIEDNLPPRKWQLGRIMETHPGEDGMVRIVSVKSNGHVKKRYLRKLARLPLSDPESEDNKAALQHGLVSTEDAVSLQDTTDDSMVPGPSKSKTEESTSLSDGRYDMKSETSRKQRKSARLASPERTIEKDRVLLSTHLTVPMPSESHKRIAMASSSTTKPDKPTKRKIEDSPKQTEKKRSKKTRIRPCTWFHSTLQVCLYVLCLLTLVVGKKYEIIQPQTGFVIENHGIAYIKRGELQLEVGFQQSTEDQENIIAACSKFELVCNSTQELSSITHCDHLFHHLEIEKQELLSEISISREKPRKKRGLLGQALNYVFGINDDVYKSIETLHDADLRLEDSTRQQSLLINAKLEQTNIVTEDKLRKLDSKLNHVIETIEEMRAWNVMVDHNRLSIQVIGIYLNAVSYFKELRSKYHKLSNAAKGKASTLDFLSQDEINEVMKPILRHLPSDLTIWARPQPKTDVIMDDVGIKFHGYLDIMERRGFDLLVVTGIPHRQNNSVFSIPVTDTPFLAVNYDNQEYFPLAESEYNKCRNIDISSYICTPDIIYRLEKRPSCVIDEIFNKPSKTPCRFSHIKLSGTFWKKLMQMNAWLYTMSRATEVALICNGVREEILLNNSGIIRIDEGCSIIAEDKILRGAVQTQRRLVKTFIKEMPPPEYNPSKHHAPELNTSLAPIFAIGEDPYASLKGPAMVYHTNTDKGKFVAAHSASVLSSIVITLIIIFVARKCNQRCKNSLEVREIKRRFNKLIKATPGPQHGQSSSAGPDSAGEV